MIAISRFIALACFFFLSATQAQADPKPPIRGLVSMGAYNFVAAGGQPDNTLAPLNAKPSIFGGLVVVASWQQLQPEQGGAIRTGVIDRALAEVRAYNVSNPEKPLAVKLRVWGGFMAPKWAKQIGGAPIRATHNGHARTVGRFWTQAYRQAWADLQTQLAARYDDEPLICEVSITQCMSFTAEPFFVPLEPAENVRRRLVQAGFNDADYRDCLSNAVADYSAWQDTRLVLAVNPYRFTAGGLGDPDFTKAVMLACRNAIGVRCVFDNHDLDSDVPEPLKPIYAYMRELGPEIEFQTEFKTPEHFPATIRLGVRQGASSIELWQDFGGFPLVSNAALKRWAALIEANTGEP